MKKVITLIIGGLLVLGGFTGGVLYKSNKYDFKVEKEEVKENSEDINYKEECTKNNDEFNEERSSEIQKAKLKGAAIIAENNPNYTKDDVDKSVANELKNIGVTKEEAEKYKVDKNIIKYL